MMRASTRRLGIAALSLTLVATLLGTTQAGIIPWLYHVVFGPVGTCGPQPYGYAGYAAAYPMAGYGCGPCAVPARPRCAPSSCSPCSGGSCPTFVGYGVRSSCETGAEVTQWKAGDGKRAPDAEAEVVIDDSSEEAVTKLAPSPVDPAPAPTTFVDETVAEESSVQKPETEASAANTEATATTGAEAVETTPGAVSPAINIEAVPPAASIGTSATETEVESSTGFVTTPEEEKATEVVTPPAAADPFGDKEFSLPKVGTPTEEESGVPTRVIPGLPEGLEEPAGIDGEASWKLDVRARRLVRRSAHGRAWIARRIAPVDAEYVLPTESVTRIVSGTRLVSRD